MASNTKKQKIQQSKASATLDKASSIEIESSLTTISQASLSVQNDFARISESLIQKHAELKAVEEAIALKKQEMETLHEVDQILLSIDEAKALHQKFVDDMKKQRDQLEKEYEELKAQKERERKREEEEYWYNLQQQRKAETDAWNDQVRTRQKQERERQEIFEKDIATREAALMAKEAEYQAALRKAATFEEEVKKEVAKAENILRNTLTKDFNHEKQLAEVLHSAELEKLRFDNKRLVEAANNYENQVKELQAQLKLAYEENVKLAKAAVDGAANEKARADALSMMTNLGGGNGTTRARS